MHGFRRVDDQVHDELLNLDRIGLDERKVRSEFETQVDGSVNRGAQKRREFANDLRQIDVRDDEPAATGIGQHLAGESGGAFARGHDGLDHRSRRIRPIHRVQRKAGISDNAREQIIEIVSHAAGEEAHTFEARSFPQALFNPAALGNIGDDADKPPRLAGFSEIELAAEFGPDPLPIVTLEANLNHRGTALGLRGLKLFMKGARSSGWQADAKKSL